jgi:hypothetical protein
MADEEVVVFERASGTEPGLGPCLQAPQAGKHAIELSCHPWAPHAPLPPQHRRLCHAAHADDTQSDPLRQLFQQGEQQPLYGTCRQS